VDEARLVHRAEELEREVQVLRAHPADAVGGGGAPQLVDGGGQARAHGVVEEDGDEGADGYRGRSRSWMSVWMCWRRAGSVSIACAARRSWSAPARSPSSSLPTPRSASARASSAAAAGGATAGAVTAGGGGPAAAAPTGGAAAAAGDEALGTAPAAGPP